MAVTAVVLHFVGLCLLVAVLGKHMTTDEVMSTISGETCNTYSTCLEGNTTVDQTGNEGMDDGECCVYCSCDPDVCLAKRNCCPGTYSRISESEPQEITKCHAMQINLGSEITNQGESVETNFIGIYMVSNCTDDNQDERCASPDLNSLYENLPQTDVATGLVYRNVYCAMCNNVTEMAPWKAYVTCSKTRILQSDNTLFPRSAEKIYEFAVTAKDNKCGVFFQPPDIVQNSADLCLPRLHTLEACDDSNGVSCGNNQTDADSKTSCCDNVTDTDACITKFEPQAQYSQDSALIVELNTERSAWTDSVPPWNQTDLTPAIFIPRSVNCNYSYVYDPYKEECRRWYCPEGRQLVGSDCVPIFSNIVKAKISISLEIFPQDDELEQFKAYNKTDMVHQVLNGMFGDDVEREVILIGLKKDRTLLYTFVLMTVSEDKDTSLRLYNSSTFNQTMSIDGPNGSITLKIELATAISLQLGHSYSSSIFIYDLKTYWTYKIVYEVNISDIESATRYTSINRMTFCTQILIGKSEVRDYVHVIDIKVSDIRLLPGEFQPENNVNRAGFRVCLSDYLREAREHLLKVPEETSYSPQALVSVVCNMMSMAGLLVTLVTYVIFDELRSIPGKNNIMLALHLLIAQALYQFGMDQTQHPVACIVLGALIHMFWLTAIFWMNACTLHMFRTFVTGQSYRSVRVLDPQVCCYALYCYSVAVSMVAVNLGVSMYRSDGKDYGYGGHVCYISTPVMVGWVFALPVGVIIILNMGFFFAVVYQISASTMRRRGKSTDRTNTIIYMKLSSLTGVTWIFGYLYMWTDLIAFEYIFIVLNAGQGVLIFISFICTKRILKLYYNFFRKHSRTCRISSCMCIRKSKMSETNGIDVNTAKMSLTASTTSKGSKGIPMVGRFSQKDWRRNQNVQKAVLNRHFSTGNCNSVNDSSDIFQDSMNIARGMSNPGAETSNEILNEDKPEESSVSGSESQAAMSQEESENADNIAIVSMHQM